MIPIVTEEFSTNLEQTFFSIDEKQSALILTLLRNNIYSNPLLSSVKEVLSNSLDEHVKYNISKPIDITLPNYFSSNISIRDYANGISKKFMLNDYTKVGLSTKSGDNLALGGFGLGRMSPLSYADLYTVISITDDEDGNRYKRNYVISKDNNKVFCSLLLEEETDEDTGVLVSFEIASKDFNAIKEYVSDNVKYISNVAINIDKQPIVAVEYTENYKSFKSVYCGAYKGTLIGLIGGLPNTLKLEDFRYNLASDVFDYIFARLNNNHIIFDIAIGEVDQSADKSIQLSERTKTYISKVLKNLVIDYRELVSIKTKLFDKYTDVIDFLKANNLCTSFIDWKDKTVCYSDWLKHCISYSKYKKNYKVRVHNTNYGLSYYKGNKYYYNDLNYEATPKELLTSFTDLHNIIIVNDIDNSYYNLDLLSVVSGLPIDRPPSKVKVRKAPVSRNTKCNRMSKYPGEIGRELNIDLKVDNLYISKDFYVKYVNETLKSHFFSFVTSKVGFNKDIYVVNDVSVVKGVWTDLIEYIKDFYKDLDTNYFYYIGSGAYTSFNLSSSYRDKFVNDNPNHIVSKFLKESNKFDVYRAGHSLFLSYLKENSIIEFKEPVFSLEELEREIKDMYSWFDQHVSFNDVRAIEYIKLVDFYNNNSTNP